MLQDRPYMQYAPPRNEMRVIFWIIGVTVAVFFLQKLLPVVFPSAANFMENTFSLSQHHLTEGKFWTLLTYALLHDPRGLVHLGFNMLMVFFIGRMLIDTVGPRRLLSLYLWGALGGAVFFIAFRWGSNTLVMGASASVFALLAFFCRQRMEEPMTFLLFFVLPVTLKPKWILYGLAGISLVSMLFSELPGQSNVAHSAHFGGLLAGWAYYRYLNSVKRHPRTDSRTTAPQIQPPRWLKRKSIQNYPMRYKVNVTNREALQAEVDRILDKINESGFGSLDEAEKATLDRAKDLLSR
jgi:membrane associated rhomboid family serine protease